MPRKKSVRNEDYLFGDDANVDVEQDNAAEMSRAMRNRGYDAMSDGSFRTAPRGLADEVAETY